MKDDNKPTQNFSNNKSIESVIEDRIVDPSRRGLFAGAAAGAAMLFVGVGGAPQVLGQTAAPVAPAPAKKRPAKLGFKPVAKSRADVLTVPEGYTANPFYRLGDPIAANVPAYKNDGT